jgi:hypothetical protein
LQRRTKDWGGGEGEQEEGEVAINE